MKFNCVNNMMMCMGMRGMCMRLCRTSDVLSANR